jgi:hypothetical protein
MVEWMGISLVVLDKESDMPAQPTVEQLREIARVYGMHLSDAELEAFRSLMTGTFESYHRIDQLAQPPLPVCYVPLMLLNRSVATPFA